MNRFFIFSLCLIFVLFGCSKVTNTNSTIEEKLQTSMKQANIQSEKIYHLEVVKNGILVFYKYKDEDIMNAGFIKNTPTGWKWVSGGGSAELQPRDGLSWVVTNEKDIPLYYSYGIITNTDIIKVKSRLKNGEEKQAKIIKTDQGIIIWVVFYDNPTNYLDIIGLSQDGKILYQYK